MADEYDKTRPLIAQLPGYRPGFSMALPPKMYDWFVANGYDMTDMTRTKPMGLGIPPDVYADG